MAKKKVNLITVSEYAATRKGWRGHPVSVGYIYNLIKKINEKKKSPEQLGFRPHPDGKGYKIEVLTKPEKNVTDRVKA